MITFCDVSVLVFNVPLIKKSSEFTNILSKYTREQREEQVSHRQPAPPLHPACTVHTDCNCS